MYRVDQMAVFFCVHLKGFCFGRVHAYKSEQKSRLQHTPHKVRTSCRVPVPNNFYISPDFEMLLHEHVIHDVSPV